LEVTGVLVSTSRSKIKDVDEEVDLADVLDVEARVCVDHVTGSVASRQAGRGGGIKSASFTRTITRTIFYYKYILRNDGVGRRSAKKQLRNSGTRACLCFLNARV
jgi:hypothetical protein